MALSCSLALAAAAAGCTAATSDEEASNGESALIAPNPSLPPLILDVPRVEWTLVGAPRDARKIAACSDGRLFALNADRSLWVNKSGGADSGWSWLASLGATQQIACANNQLVAFNDDRSIYLNIGTDTAQSWRWLGRPWAANQLSAGTELDVFFPSVTYFALNDDRSFWSSKDGVGWTSLGAIGATSRVAGAGGYLETRVFALNDDKSVWVNTGEGRGGYWHQLLQYGQAPFVEIAARSETTLYSLDTSYNLRRGDVYKLDELERLDMPVSDFAPTWQGGYDYPSNSTLDWSYIIQGVTHDDASWYLTSQYGIHKIPVDHDLNDHSAGDPGASWWYRSAPIPDVLYQGASGYDHLGQPAYAGDYVYAPLEHSTHGAAPIVVAYDTDLNTVSWATLVPSGPTNEAPWVAINPVDGLLYTSNFQISPSNPIRTFKITWLMDTSGKRTLELDPVGTFVLRDEAGAPLTIDAIGGGAFSSKGHLWLSSDASGAVYGFDPTGHRRKSFGVDYTGYGSRQELEGLTIWDLDDGRAPNVWGELHLVMSKRDVSSFHFNSVYFKHYELTDPRDKTKI